MTQRIEYAFATKKKKHRLYLICRQNKKSRVLLWVNGNQYRFFLFKLPTKLGRLSKIKKYFPVRE